MWRPFSQFIPWLLVASIAGFVPTLARAQEESEWETDGEAHEREEVLATSAPDVTELGLDAKLDALDGYLEEIDAPTRRYFYGWLVTQSALIGGQLTIAFTADDAPMRGSYFIGSGVAAASIGLLLLGKRPGMGAVSRYRAMPSSTSSEKEAKLAAGEAALAGQALADRKGVSWLRHLLGVGAALGSGAAVALLYEHSLKLAAQRVFATFFVSELQIMTRSGAAIRNHESYLGGRKPGVEFGFAPLLDWHAQGVSMNARF